MDATHKAVDRLRAWSASPACFVREVLGATADAWQSESLDAIRGDGISRLCLKACAGPGKSTLLAWVGWWWLTTQGRRGAHPKGIAVSITADNLRDNLWAELAKWRQRSTLLQHWFDWKKERIESREHPETWFLAARSFPKSASAGEQGATLSGMHSEYPLVLLDETGAMSPAVGRAAEQAMGTCRRGLIVQAGNPLSQDGLLYDSAVTARQSWSVIEITADPDDPRRTPRVSADWAREQIERYGRANPWVEAYILGKFPATGINALLGAEEVGEAMRRDLRARDYQHAPRLLGVDVARFGDDRTVIFPRQGLATWDPVVLRDQRSDQVAGAVLTRLRDWDADGVLVDGTGGWGSGVVDALRQANAEPVEVQFAGKPLDARFFNKRAEMWWSMAEWVRDGGSLPDIPELVRELTAPTYYLQSGKLRLEDKDQIKSRLGWSPDLADALALTFAHPVVARRDRTDLNPLHAGGGRVRGFRDYDPTG